MPNTHCLPSGSLGSNELAVPPIPFTNTIFPVALGSNNVRGVVVFGHGLNDPNNLIDVENAFFTALQADGWISYITMYQEDEFNGPGSTGVFNDVNADSGHGSRYLASAIHTWDHTTNWIHRTYGATIPIVVGGFSWGAWRAIQIAISATVQTRPIAFFAHCPLQFLTNANTANTPGTNWSTLTSTGADLSNTCLNTVGIPGMVGWSNPDTAAMSYTIKTPCDAAIAAAQPVTEYATVTGHSWLSATSTQFESYFTSTIDPLAPKAF